MAELGASGAARTQPAGVDLALWPTGGAAMPKCTRLAAVAL